MQWTKVLLSSGQVCLLRKEGLISVDQLKQCQLCLLVNDANMQTMNSQSDQTVSTTVVENMKPFIRKDHRMKKKKKKGKIHALKVTGRKHKNHILSMCKLVQCLNNTTSSVFLVFSYIVKPATPFKSHSFPWTGNADCSKPCGGFVLLTNKN